MEDVIRSRKAQLFWNPSMATGQTRRRKEFVDRQHRQRRDAQDRLRKLVECSQADDEEEEDDDVAVEHASEPAGGAEADAEGDYQLTGKATAPCTSQRRKRDKIAKRKKYVSQMSLPEWMIEVPQDLNGSDSLEDGWIVLPRPEGVHSTLVAANSRTIVRDKHGLQLHAGQLEVPGGSTNCRGHATVLDGIYQEKPKAFYAFDCLCWNGLPLWDCGAIMRRSWLLSNLTSLGAGETTLETFVAVNRASTFDLALLVIPHYECSYEGLLTCFQSQFTFSKDGLLFMQKSAPYGEGDTNPCVLQYKDITCSKWCPNPGDDKVMAVFAVDKDGYLKCSDGVGIETVPSMDQHCMKNSLLKCAYSDALPESSDTLHLKDLTIVGPAGLRRLYADSSSKVIFNSNRRNERPPTFSDILRHAEECR